MSLLTLDHAKTHLRITDDLHDAEVQGYLDEAEATILDYLKPTRTGEPRDDWPWTAETLPKPVEAAMLVFLSHPFDDRRLAITAEEKGDNAGVWDAVKRAETRCPAPSLPRRRG